MDILFVESLKAGPPIHLLRWREMLLKQLKKLSAFLFHTEGHLDSQKLKVSVCVCLFHQLPRDRLSLFKIWAIANLVQVQ